MGQSQAGSAGSSSMPQPSMPSWSDATKFNPSYGSSATNFNNYWNVKPTSDWSKNVSLGADPYHFNLGQDFNKYWQPQETEKAKQKSDWREDIGKVGRFATDIFNQNKNNSIGFGSDPYGRQNITASSGGVDQKGDLTFVYPQQAAPFTIAGSPSKWGQIGSLIGAAAMAPFTGGMSLGAAMGAIGGASALGGTAGSLFG